jgi:hypothetical protein
MTKSYNYNKKAHNEAVARYAKRNPLVGREANKRYRERHKGSIEYRIIQMVAKAKTRARQKQWDFDLDKEYIKSIWPEDNMCPVFKKPFTFNEKNHDFNSSLDRIDTTKGYLRGNVVVVSWRANNLKSDGTLDEFKALIEFYQK